MQSRRNAIKKLVATSGVVAGLSLSHRIEAAEAVLSADLKGNVNHSVCRWCYNSIPLEDLCKAAKNIGLTSIELTGPDDWPLLKKYGLTSAMPNGAGKGIEKGFNDPQYHDELVASFEAVIPKAANAGLNQIICFSGNRNGLDDEKGIENCAIGLTSNTARFEGEGLSAPLHFNFLYIKHSYFPLSRLPNAVRGLSCVQRSG